MDEFKAIYRILTALRAGMDCDEFDQRMISPETLGITPNKWAHLLRMMAQKGYVEGIAVDVAADGHCMVSLSYPAITLDGLAYLQENSLMQKAHRLAKGIKESIPGL